MNYSHHHQSYDISQQTPVINNMNQQYYQQNMTQYPNCQQTFGNHNFPYSSGPYMQTPFYPPYQNTYNYNAVVSSNSDANINVNQSSKPKVEKRASQPLTVIDPKKMEVIDLTKASKPKNNSLLDEIQQPDDSKNLIPDLPVTTATHNVDQEIKVEEIVQKVIESIQSAEDVNHEVCIEPCLKSPLTSLSMRQSHSIPYKLDSFAEKTLVHQINSSSETDLHQKSPLSFHNLQEMFNNQRKIYNRDSLLKIGKSERSLKPPFSLDNCDLKEIISKEVNEIPKMLGNKMGGLMNRKSFKVINFASPKSGSLSRITNGYLPPHLRLSEECSMNTHLEKCRRSLKSILNKIAPQNFDLCIIEIKTIIKGCDPQIVKIEDCIDCLIEEIFDKAVKEETYSVTYANLCTKIAKFDDEYDSKWNFKVSLLNRCRKMFETPLQDQLKSVKEHWDRKVEEEKDEKLRNLYRSDIEEQVKKARDKYFGNIRFIGELYLHDLLKPKIIHSCVQTLLPKTNDEDAMLSMCKLIETCGKKFHEQHGDKMGEYIKSMGEITVNEQLETRIRYRVLDIIEMSERNWSLRTIQAQKMIRPKTLEEMKNDDSEDKMIAAAKFPATKSQNRSSNLKSVQISNEMKFKQHQNRNQQIDLNSLSVGQNENFNLKPSYGCWSSGSKEKDLAEWKNVDNKKGNKGKYPSSSSKLHQSMQGHNKSSPIRYRDDSPGKKIMESKFSILLAENDGNDNRMPSPTIHLSSYESKSEDDIELVAREDLLNSLLQTKNLNVSAWCAQDNIDELITDWLDGIMEKDKAARNLVGDKLADLVACDKLPKNKLIDGVTQFMELIDDLITDIPKIWLFLAEFLERFIRKDNPLGDVHKAIFENRLLDRNVSECIIMIVKHVIDRLGRDFIEDLDDGDLRALVDSVVSQPYNVPLLQSHQLTFLIKSDQSSLSFSCPSVNKFSDSFKSELISLLPNDIEHIYGLLESRFNLPEMQTDEFVYNMAYCIFSFICDLSSEIEVINFIVEKQLFFIRIINNMPEFETQILLALVHFAHRLDEKDLLLTVIENISGKIISNDAFYHFIQTTERSSSSSSSSLLCQTDDTDQNYAVIVTAIRSALDNDRR